MKPRIKAYNWNWDTSFGFTTYYVFPDGRICRVDVFDNHETFEDIHEYNWVPFVGY